MWWSELQICLVKSAKKVVSSKFELKVWEMSGINS